jgi:PAS domain S-box-containing protein
MDTQPIRVLLVDDDEDDYVMTRDMLAELGRGAFLLDWVSSYEEARAAVGRGGHDVYLLDYRLGERSGLDLLREAGGEGRGAPMILLTGQGGDEVDTEAMKAGAADYLIKGRLDAPLLGRSIRYAVERARASRALRESEERYHRLVELSPDAILVHAEGEIVFVNGAGAKLLRADTQEQIVGRPIKEFVRHDRQDGVGRRIYGDAGDASDAAFLEEKLVRSDGTEVCVEAAAVPFVYKDRPAVQVVARDISKRKQMEERLLHDAFHDALTGLPNRALFMDHLRSPSSAPGGRRRSISSPFSF